MFEQGFFATRAPFFMDIVTLVVGILPLFVAGAIYLSRQKKYKFHAYAQKIIFILSVIVLAYFEAGVRQLGGFDSFMQDSGVSHNYAFIVLVAHITISVITLIIWLTTLLIAKKQLMLNKHKKAGYLVFGGVIITSLTGIWVYLLLFVY
jgi:putative membrane protein